MAVKLLPLEFASRQDWKQRFAREAQIIASLNHPHICTLYDVGQQELLTDGRKSQVDFLVMEFLQGETLADRLRKGPLAHAQAMRIGIEVCEALDAAHIQGLTHRDLKPGNVMLTRGGAKLLDFGLAKNSGPVVAGLDSMSAAATSFGEPLTSKGTIVGTIQYMAPEQIEGRECDARTDIWAFGNLLYEMISGTRAFEGSSPASLMASILEREPKPLSRAGMPQRLWDVLHICLEKNPADRWQSTRDLLRELRWLANETSPGAITAPSTGLMSRRAWLLTGGTASLAVVAASVRWQWNRWSATGVSGPPVIVLMDSTHPERIYDDETRKAGGTNADDLTDLLRDLPVVLLKENTNASWHREYEVLQENPALIVAHRSCFYDATMLGEASRELPFINLSWDKFELFAGFVAQGNPRTRILAYSRGSWKDDNEVAQWVASMEHRFPPLRGRLDAMRVPMDRATFRNPVTGGEIRKHIEAQLKLLNAR